MPSVHSVHYTNSHQQCSGIQLKRISPQHVGDLCSLVDELHICHIPKAIKEAHFNSHRLLLDKQ